MFSRRSGLETLVWRVGKDAVPCELQEVFAPGTTITDLTQSQVSLWGTQAPLGSVLLVTAQVCERLAFHSDNPVALPKACQIII